MVSPQTDARSGASLPLNRAGTAEHRRSEAVASGGLLRMGTLMEGRVSPRSEPSPAVSVIMPVFETPAAMLDKAIDSVLGQTFRDFELIILNDGSTDPRVRPHLDQWASRDARIRLYHEPHRGVPTASNRALALARGELVARQDADDWSSPERLSRQVDILHLHPEVVLAGSDTFWHSADGTSLWRRRLPHGPAEISAALWRENPFIHGSTMFRREKALQIGGYREMLPCSSDYDFLWRLSETGGSVNLDEVLYHYRFTAGSISARRAVDQARGFRAAQAMALARQAREPEATALEAVCHGPEPDTLRATLKQADHFMLAGDFAGARAAYIGLVKSNPGSALAWAKLLRLAVFAAIPRAREVCFR